MRTTVRKSATFSFNRPEESLEDSVDCPDPDLLVEVLDDPVLGHGRHSGRGNRGTGEVEMENGSEDTSGFEDKGRSGRTPRGGSGGWRVAGGGQKIN